MLQKWETDKKRIWRRKTRLSGVSIFHFVAFSTSEAKRACTAWVWGMHCIFGFIWINVYHAVFWWAHWRLAQSRNVMCTSGLSSNIFQYLPLLCPCCLGFGHFRRETHLHSNCCNRKTGADDQIQREWQKPQHRHSVVKSHSDSCLSCQDCMLS